MASADAKENGVFAWMAAVRASMDNDSSRQIFEDQVQSHAFIFLDNYLEHILAGPKQGPIIELVKTPARKRTAPRGTRAAAVAKNTAPVSLDDDISTRAIPVNSFHKALLQAKERSVQDMQKPIPEPPSTSHGPTINAYGQSESVQLDDIHELTESNPHTGDLPLQHFPRDTSSATPFPVLEHGTQLSAIAEGDESSYRSHAAILPLSTPSDLDEPSQFPHQFQKHIATEANPALDVGSQGNSSPDLLSSPAHADPLDFPLEMQSLATPIGSHAEPLPSRTPSPAQKNRERNAFTAPLPTIPASDSILVPQTISVPLNDVSPKAFPHKSGAVGFPTLPAPSPLRKSMRFIQDLPPSVVHSTIAPLPVPLGKRTSWLMKAREAKAMDGTSVLPCSSTAGTSTVPRASTAVKRKSGEMLGTLPLGSDTDTDQRKPKVAKSAEVVIVPPTSLETEKTVPRDTRGEPITVTSTTAAMPAHHSESHAMEVDVQITHLNSTEEGFIDLFKRTVEGLGARAARSAGKSLGGDMVAALAEARAAAEARVAERNKVDVRSSDLESICGTELPDEEPVETQVEDNPPRSTSSLAERTGGRLSLSDLVPVSVPHNDLEEPARIVRSVEQGTRLDSDGDSVSTTPPDSPPSKGSSGFVKPTGPVFNKPPPQPVFMPPAPKQPSATSALPKEPTLPVAVSLDIPVKLTTPSDAFPPLVQGVSETSAQFPQSGIFSSPVFEKRGEAPTWVPSTQDTLYNDDSQPAAAAVYDDDDDDSWPLEEKLAAAESGWRPFDFSNVDKEDTWSSLPTESQGLTRSLTTVILDDGEAEVDMKDARLEREQQADEIVDAERSIIRSSKPVEIAETRTTSVAPELAVGAASQTSMGPAASSSQPQAGFFSQATRLVNNMLGGGKKAKPELKSLQLAAAVAKKQQEEADKKAQRLKDMEARRQVAIAKKAEEEKSRLLEEEKKSKDDIEKRRREREENTDRRPLKPPVSAKKVDDDGSKKRKVVAETEKMRESKKPPSRDKKDLALQAKSAATPAIKVTASKSAKTTPAALVSSATYNTTQNPPLAKPVIPEAKPFKVVPSSLKGKAKAKPQEDDIGDKLPSTMVQSQMAARVKAQMQTAKMAAPEVPSESIELPDINSEYSDSEDEHRARTFDPPEWAQSPELRQALQMQSTVNPDDIFGEIRPLRMEEIFRTRQSRFRARSSSANWSGTDRLTVEEIREYERRMGFRSTHAS